MLISRFSTAPKKWKTATGSSNSPFCFLRLSCILLLFCSDPMQDSADGGREPFKGGGGGRERNLCKDWRGWKFKGPILYPFSHLSFHQWSIERSFKFLYWPFIRHLQRHIWKPILLVKVLFILISTRHFIIWSTFSSHAKRNTCITESPSFFCYFAVSCWHKNLL